MGGCVGWQTRLSVFVDVGLVALRCRIDHACHGTQFSNGLDWRRGLDRLVFVMHRLGHGHGRGNAVCISEHAQHHFGCCISSRIDWRTHRGPHWSNALTGGRMENWRDGIHCHGALHGSSHMVWLES